MLGVEPVWATLSDGCKTCSTLISDPLLPSSTPRGTVRPKRFCFHVRIHPCLRFFASIPAVSVLDWVARTSAMGQIDSFEENHLDVVSVNMNMKSWSRTQRPPCVSAYVRLCNHQQTSLVFPPTGRLITSSWRPIQWKHSTFGLLSRWHLPRETRDQPARWQGRSLSLSMFAEDAAQDGDTMPAKGNVRAKLWLRLRSGTDVQIVHHSSGYRGERLDEPSSSSIHRPDTMPPGQEKSLWPSSCLVRVAAHPRPP